MKQSNAIITDFTQGSVPKHLVRFMLPFMATNALQVLYSLVDMIIVGKFVGSAGLSAVSQGGMLVNFAMMLGLGLSNSGQVFVAQLIGANRRQELRYVIGTMFTAMAIFSVFLTAAVFCFRGVFVSWLRVPPEALDMANTYVAWCSAGLIFSCGYNVTSSTLRGMGDSRHPFLFVTVSSVLNLFLDYILTGLLGYGVTGAAIATACSQAVSFLISLAFLYRHKEQCCFDFLPASFRIHGGYLRRMLKLGIPMALQACALNITMMIVNSFVNLVGVAASATYGVGLKIDDIFNKVTLGIQFAAAPMVGQNSGADRPDRVRSTVLWTWGISGAICIVFMLLYLRFGVYVFRLFTDDEEVIALAPVFISGIAWTFPLMAGMRGGNALLQGIGNSPLMMAFIFIDGILRIIFCYVFGFTLNLGFYGFTLGFALAPLGIVIPGVLYFLSGKWQGHRILEDRPQEKA